jgi:catechol-2,3-dioxygenase
VRQTAGGVSVARVKRKPSFHVKALTIVCTDRWRSDQFYTEVLGAVALDGEITCRWYQLGSFTITVMSNAVERTPADFGQHPMMMLYLEVDDLELAEGHFARHKVEVIVPSDGQMMIIADPDGLPIEIWQHEDDTTEPIAQPGTPADPARRQKRRR